MLKQFFLFSVILKKFYALKFTLLLLAFNLIAFAANRISLRKSGQVEGKWLNPYIIKIVLLDDMETILDDMPSSGFVSRINKNPASITMRGSSETS